MVLDALRVLKRIGNIPTATGHDHFVQFELGDIFKESFDDNKRVELLTDEIGNTHWSYKGPYEGDKRRGVPTLVFMAHTDHPAYTISREGGELVATVRGGINKKLIRGSQINLHRDRTPQVAAVATLDDAVDEEGLKYRLSGVSSRKRFDFATMQMPKYQEKFKVSNGMIIGPVLDDFAAIAMQASAFSDIVERELPIDVICSFTRAEEVGLLGAYFMGKYGILPNNSIVLSNECSSYKAARHRENSELGYDQLVDIGGGVILRTGDRSTPNYHSGAIQILRAAKSLMHEGTVQEKCMTGGSCEATAIAAYANKWGYRSAGVAFPLKFYHNDGAIEGLRQFVPEEISEDDFNNGFELLVRTADVLAINPGLYFENMEREISPAHENARKVLSNLYKKFLKEGLIAA